MLPKWTGDSLNNVAAMLSLWHWPNGIHWEGRTRLQLQVEFLDFTLELLGALLGPPLEVLDLSLHGGNRRLLLGHFQPQRLLGFQPGFVPHVVERLLHPRFDGQIHFTFGVVKLPLFSDAEGRVRLALCTFGIAQA